MPLKGGCSDDGCFNPRSREGNDLMSSARPDPRSVSIHVPARGTTSGMMKSRRYSTGFNPRSREGNDWENDIVSAWSEGFNPRSREGNDGCVL